MMNPNRDAMYDRVSQILRRAGVEPAPTLHRPSISTNPTPFDVHHLCSYIASQCGVNSPIGYWRLFIGEVVSGITGSSPGIIAPLDNHWFMDALMYETEKEARDVIPGGRTTDYSINKKPILRLRMEIHGGRGGDKKHPTLMYLDEGNEACVMLLAPGIRASVLLSASSLRSVSNRVGLYVTPSRTHLSSIILAFESNLHQPYQLLHNNCRSATLKVVTQLKLKELTGKWWHAQRVWIRQHLIWMLMAIFILIFLWWLLFADSRGSDCVRVARQVKVLDGCTGWGCSIGFGENKYRFQTVYEWQGRGCAKQT